MQKGGWRTMDETFSRERLLFGDAAMQRLWRAHVAVFGVGGVGGYVCEALARSGIGHLTLIDGDTVSVSNINRQIIALHSTVGQKKTDVMRARLLDISPEMQVSVRDVYYGPENAADFDLTDFSYVVDAIDDVQAKVELAVRCEQAGVPLISSMGAGNKLYPERFELADIYETSVCPLARTMRAALRKRGVKRLQVVYSKEPPRTAAVPSTDGTRVPGSTAFAPSAAGLVLAGAVVRALARIGEEA